MKKYLLEFTVFVSGAVVMILELTGSRILAPFVGTSLHVWTSLIGIILACLSIGYWLGGKTADKYPTYKAYASIIFFASCATLFTASANEEILRTLSGAMTSVSWNAITSTILLFAPASILLGMVSPYAVRLRMTELAQSGRTVGNLYAISTLGSIVGTFAAGFFLTAYFGSRSLLYILAFTLLLLSVLVSAREYWKAKVAVGIVILSFAYLTGAAEAAAEKRGYIDVDTAYSRVIVTEGKDPYSDRRIRILKTSADAVQSGMYVDDANALVFPYTKYYRLAGHFRPGLTRALMIGGGAYSYPKDFLRSFPHARLDVVEIDPALTDIAKKYFFLPNDERLSIIHEDGRTFINREEKTYDAIFVDAYQSLTPPFHLLTKEAVQRLHAMLDDEGVVIVNVISAAEGEKSAMFRAVYHTYAAVFPHVSAYPVQYAGGGTEAQNIMIIAEKSAEAKAKTSANLEFAEYLTHRFLKDVPNDLPALTDDFAPVERYMMKVK